MRCPDCMTATIADAQVRCQACGLVRILHGQPAAPPARDLAPAARAARRPWRVAPQTSEPTELALF